MITPKKRIALAAVATFLLAGVASAEMTQLSTSPGFWATPAASHDGELIAYTGYPTTDITYNMPRLHVMNNDGSDARLLTKEFDHPPGGLIWEANDRSIYFTAQDKGYINVFQSDLDGEVSAVTQGEQAINLSSANRSTKSILSGNEAVHQNCFAPASPACSI